MTTSGDSLMRLVERLDKLRQATGSYRCPPEVERELTSMALQIMAAPQRRQMIEEVLRNLGQHSDADWIFRSSLTIDQEPASMESVFMPRDPRRSGIFLPYALYALGKLNANFQRPAVQADLRRAGHNPQQVRLAPLIQVVAGARDAAGALGRERTVSFSAHFDLVQRTCTCQVVFGLPLLATRPVWKKKHRATTVEIKDLKLGSWRGAGAEQLQITWAEAGRPVPRQTHQAVLIPEQGIAYEQLAAKRLARFRLPGSHLEVRCPLPLPALDRLLEQLVTTAQTVVERGIGAAHPRLDGVLTRAAQGTTWGGLNLVGVS